MIKKFLYTTFIIVLLQFSQTANAGSNVTTRFGGWVGHKQSNHLLDASGWHACYSSRGGNCGSRTVTIGKSKCTSWSVNFGFSYEPQGRIAGLELSAGGSRSWRACNTRSETITCSPHVHYKGRAELIATARYGKLIVQGRRPYTQYETNWNRAVHACDTPGFWRASIKRVTRIGRCIGFSCSPDKKSYATLCKTARDTVRGYLPEKRWSQCAYRRI